MSTKSEMSSTENHPNVMAGIVKRFGQIAILLILQATILFLSAGRLNWAWAWVFLGIYLVSISTNTFLMRNNPETLAERGQAETRDWDKIVGGLWSLAQFLVLPIVAGLDTRFGWTRQSSTAWHVVGAMVFAIGLGIFGWAIITNAYFSTAVRIQSDRGQSVCRTGPYRFVRHPGYIGTILQSLGIPFLLGSLWALIPGIMAAILMVIRTSLEDRTLQVELPGYQDYVHEVHYRLVPGIW